jgi:5-methylcytosine-specific restriction protein A
MPTLSELRPAQKRKVIDLVRDAGVDVSKWAKFPGGKARAAANPKYCYEWSFVEPKRVAVLNLWFEQMKQRGQDIVFDLNFREYSDARGERNQDRVKLAIREKLPIRIIVLDGEMGNPKGSIVSKRQLDPAIWRVTAVDQNIGDYTLTRGKATERENAIDDLSAPPEGNRFPDRANVVVQVIKRDNRVRAHAIKRANGKCEYCGVQGFPTTNGDFYVEAHHIIALCDSGYDTVDNVIALCPQHHRQAHYGKDAESLESESIKILKKLNEY